jgi:diguanylate cyclase (GGDEF)-like protein/PAS domain S-box-containing protein
MAAKKDTKPGKRSAKKRDSGDALRLREERFRSLLDLSAEWYWEQDENYRFTLITGAGFGKTGIDPQQYLGTMRWDHGAVPVGDGGSWDKHKAGLKARQPFANYVFKRLNPRGELRYISTTGQPVFDGKKRFKGYRGTARDITAGVRAEQLLRLEHAVNRSLAEADSVSVALREVIHAICSTEGWECGRYFRVDEKAGALRLDESWGVPETEIQQFLERSNQRSHDIGYKPGVGLMGQVWQSGQPLWVADVNQDARALRAAFTIDAGIRGGFVFPVKSEGKTIGVLAFNNREVRYPEERLLKAIHVIGAQIGQFLQRKQAEEERRLFRVALDDSADMILLVDRNTMRYVDVNQTVCKLLGYSREELLRMGPQDLLPESRGELAQAHDELIANPSRPSGMRSYFRCKDGSRMPFESTRHVLRSGNSYIIAAICRDIRERLAAEETQRQQVALIAQSAEKDKLLRLFYDLPFVGLAVTSPTSKRWLQVNDYMCEMLGYPREELMELAWTEITHPDDLAANLALFKRLAAGEFDSFQFDKRFLRKDGGIVDTTMECRCMRRRDGSVETVVIMVQNITERKRTEAALKRAFDDLQQQAITDSLTGLYNRRFLHEVLPRELTRAHRKKTPVAVMMIDIDHFKRVNDTYGHETGDRVLKEIALLIKATVRASDICCRYGGEEISVVLPEAPIEGARRRAEAIRAAIEKHVISFPAQKRISVTVSLGVAVYPDHGGDAEALLRAADKALYEAKNGGRNCVVVRAGSVAALQETVS